VRPDDGAAYVGKSAQREQIKTPSQRRRGARKNIQDSKPFNRNERATFFNVGIAVRHLICLTFRTVKAEAIDATNDNIRNTPPWQNTN
jgi:uncharacterized membrane protein